MNRSNAVTTLPNFPLNSYSNSLPLPQCAAAILVGTFYIENTDLHSFGSLVQICEISLL